MPGDGHRVDPRGPAVEARPGVASADGEYMSDLRIDGERVALLGLDIAEPGDEVVDVSGCYILPGGIDVHTHFDLPLGDGTRTADSFATGTRAAIAGGTTTILDYATQFRGETLKEGLANWHALADGNCRCDYGFHMAITEWNDSVKAELPDVIAAGVTSFKMYMAYKGNLQVEDGVIYQALRELKKLGGLLCAHCENGDVIVERVSELLAAGKTGPEFHPLSRPQEVETEAVDRLLMMAKLVDAPVYVVHTSAAPSMDRIVLAKMEGVRAFAETCPQYLYLDDELYAKDGFEAAKYVCAPPLRAKFNQPGLWAALQNGLADVIATDHCSFNFAGQKDRGRDVFTKIPNGTPGVEHRMPLMYGGVAEGRIDLAQMVALCSTNPAKIFGLYPKKGVVAPGSDADLVILDPQGETFITAATQYQNVDYTPYEGFCLHGAIRSVYLRGTPLYADGAFLMDEPVGRYVGRGASGTKGVSRCIRSI